MQPDQIKKLKFGDLVWCNFQLSSPAYSYTSDLRSPPFYDGQRNPIYLKNMYDGPHFGMFIASHRDSINKLSLILVCPISDETTYADLDVNLVKFSKMSDVEDPEKFTSEMHTLNCRMLISLCQNQVTCQEKCGHFKDTKLTEITQRIQEHLKEVFLERTEASR